jgi:hypothetical protein
MNNSINPGYPDYGSTSTSNVPKSFLREAAAYQKLEKGPQDSVTRNAEDNLQIDMFAQVQDAMTSGHNDVEMQEEHIIGQLSQTMSLPTPEGNPPLDDPNSIWHNGNVESIEASNQLGDTARAIEAGIGNPTGFGELPPAPPVSYDNYQMPDVGYGLHPTAGNPFSQFPQKAGNYYPPYAPQYAPPESYGSKNSLGA